MIVWGGKPGSDTENAWRGGRYHPAKGWSPLSRANEPIERTYAHTAVWGGDKMIVFGGFGVRRVSDVGVPGVPLRSEAGTAWSEMSSEGAPGGRGQHTAVWTGKEMIVSGWALHLRARAADGAGRTRWPFRPGTPICWSPMAGMGAGGPRYLHTAVWASGPAPGRGRLDPVGRAGRARGRRERQPEHRRHVRSRHGPLTLYPAAGAPAARCQQVAVWTGSGCLLLWGGADVHAIDIHLSGRRRTAGAVRAGRLHHPHGRGPF